MQTELEACLAELVTCQGVAPQLRVLGTRCHVRAAALVCI